MGYVIERKDNTSIFCAHHHGLKTKSHLKLKYAEAMLAVLIMMIGASIMLLSL